LKTGIDFSHEKEYDFLCWGDIPTTNKNLKAAACGSPAAPCGKFCVKNELEKLKHLVLLLFHPSF
jgi:hypothetical protein